MWIFDKLFNRKIEGKSSLDDLAENVVVNKETNTTEIGGNLNVNGKIKAQSVLQFPAFQTMPEIINTDTLPIVADERFIDARELQKAIFVNFTDASHNTTIFTGNGLIIVDKNIDIVNTLASMSSFVGSNENSISFDKTKYDINRKLAIIPLYGTIYVTLSYEY
ncbi:MAG: hypothetical protein MSS80_07065 [Mollicutes bacterium]|nr:hypothetical protein [Mollicutes bacterium]